MSLFADVSATPQLQHGPISDVDAEAIRRAVRRIQDGFNANDADLMTQDFGRDATVVTAAGLALAGRHAIVASYSAGLAGFMREQYVRYEVVDLRPLAPHVVVAGVEATATRPDGSAVDVGHSMRSLYVLARADGRWWVAARQDTVAPN